MTHLFCVENIGRWGSNKPLGAKMCFFDLKIWIFWVKNSIFCMVIAIFVNRAYHKLYPGPPPKKIPFPSNGSFFGAHPCFWPFWACVSSQVSVPLILDRFQQNLVGPSGPSKKWSRLTMDLVRAGIAEKRPFLHSAEKCFFFGKKNAFYRKKQQKFLKRLVSILEKGTF